MELAAKLLHLRAPVDVGRRNEDLHRTELEGVSVKQGSMRGVSSVGGASMRSLADIHRGRSGRPMSICHRHGCAVTGHAAQRDGTHADDEHGGARVREVLREDDSGGCQLKRHGRGGPPSEHSLQCIGSELTQGALGSVQCASHKRRQLSALRLLCDRKEAMDPS